LYDLGNCYIRRRNIKKVTNWRIYGRSSEISKHQHVTCSYKSTQSNSWCKILPLTKSIAPILLSRKNGTFLEVVMNSLKTLSLDKSTEVRKGTLLAVAELLMHFSIQNLNNYENNLILILLNSLSDDNKEI
jgi:hypothetical protein